MQLLSNIMSLFAEYKKMYTFWDLSFFVRIQINKIAKILEFQYTQYFQKIVFWILTNMLFMGCKLMMSSYLRPFETPPPPLCLSPYQRVDLEVSVVILYITNL